MHVSCDNSSTHKTEAIRRRLVRHTHASTCTPSRPTHPGPTWSNLHPPRRAPLRRQAQQQHRRAHLIARRYHRILRGGQVALRRGELTLCRRNRRLRSVAAATGLRRSLLRRRRLVVLTNGMPIGFYFMDLVRAGHMLTTGSPCSRKRSLPCTPIRASSGAAQGKLLLPQNVRQDPERTTRSRSSPMASHCTC